MKQRQAAKKVLLSTDIFDAAADLIVVIDKDHNIIFANKAFIDFCKVSKKEVINLKCYEVSHKCSTPCSFPDFICPHEEIFKAKKGIKTRHQHFSADSSEKVFEITASPVMDENGEVMQMIEILRDITEYAIPLKEAETQLTNYQTFLDSVLEGIGDAVFVIDKEMKVLYANSGYLKQAGKTMEEIKGDYCYKSSHGYSVPCYKKGEKCVVDETFKDGGHHNAVHKHSCKDGTTVDVELNSYPLKSSSGEVFAVIETISDITEQTKLQNQLRESEERYRTLYNNAPDMMQSINQEGIIIECNDAALNNLGYEREELIGKNFKEIVLPEYHGVCMAKLRELFENGSCESELYLLRKDGSTIRVLAKSFAIYDSEGRFLKANVIMRDITELSRLIYLEEHLRSQLIQSQKMEAIATLAAGIAHDFNNMLTGIIGYSQLAFSRTTEQLVKQLLIKSINTAEKASELTRQILLIGRKLPPEKKPLILNQLVNESMKMLSRLVEENIEIKLSLFPSLPPIDADSSQLMQILMNLVVNARDAMPNGGMLEIKTEKINKEKVDFFDYGQAKAEDYVVLSVSDTGSGIPEDIRHRIFDPFFSTKEQGKGTGLGLAVTDSIVRNHDGWINLYSEKGKGTEFRIIFPALEMETDTFFEQQHLFSDDLSIGNGKILLVDDDEVVREPVEGMLRSLGYKVILASSGEDAIAIYKENSEEIDLVIMDNIMPKMNGLEAFGILKKINPSIKVIIASGYMTLDDTKDFSKQGIMGFLNKPYTLNNIANITFQALKEN